jgi:hypothetical protein
VAAVNRIDNVKTAVVRGAGAWGEIHPTYRSYARAVGFHIDACQPREPQAKGKAEAAVRLGRLRVDPAGRRFSGLGELQEWTDGRQYAVPFRHAYTPVEVRGCAGVVQIWADGRVVKEYPRSTKERLLMDPDCFEGEATDRVAPPPPLGRMGKKLQEIYELPVEARPLDLYAALSEVAR